MTDGRERIVSRKRAARGACLLAVLAGAGVNALAHPGPGTADGFAGGFGHPLGGLDHLLAMLAVGLWAAGQPGRARWGLPLVFLAVMAAGGALGMAGLPLSFAEAGILLSLPALGLLVAGGWRVPAFPACLAAGAFALFHGHAHGAEMPPGAFPGDYAAGFLLASASLHASGYALAAALQRRARRGTSPLVRAAGVALAVSGLWLWAV